MKTGYLAKEQFKDWKADEVKALAKELGASCDGKKEEIIEKKKDKKKNKKKENDKSES